MNVDEMVIDSASTFLHTIEQQLPIRNTCMATANGDLKLFNHWVPFIWQEMLSDISPVQFLQILLTEKWERKNQNSVVSLQSETIPCSNEMVTLSILQSHLLESSQGKPCNSVWVCLKVHLPLLCSKFLQGCEASWSDKTLLWSELIWQ